MSLVNYPPLIEAKLPAFSLPSDAEAPITLSIPYSLNKAVSLSDFNEMVVMIKAVTTGTVKLNISTTQSQLEYLKNKQKYALFQFNRTLAEGAAATTAFTPIPGNYYKVQIAFKKGSVQSPWSSVGVIKCTSQPIVSITSLEADVDNVNPTLYIGSYQNADVSEKIYSYNFTIYDDTNNIFEASGDILHDGSTDENIASVGVKSTLRWRPQLALEKYKKYRVALSIETINGYTISTAPYVIKQSNTIDAKIPACLLATPDYDNGRVHLSFVKEQNAYEEEPFTGNFVITRYTKSENAWHEICRFNTLTQTPSQIGIIWTDYTLAHGEQYLYAIQAYNSKELYSNRMYHITIATDDTGKVIYKDFDEFGEPYYLTGDFEDMFLTDGERQLKIRFNPQVSSFKPTILENKMETIGSKYPFIFRNGRVNYKEFPISGLLSYLIDEEELFMSGIRPPEETARRTHTPAKDGGIESKKDWAHTMFGGSKLTSDNFFRERQFKLAALEWLTNGKPKLFRSPGEGNYIVRLLNTSLSPNETVGRMLHTFNSTAYEVDEYNFDNLQKYNLLSSKAIDNRPMSFREALIGERYAPNYNMYYVYISNVIPGTEYRLTFGDQVENNPVNYIVGITGSLYLDTDLHPLTSIELVSGDYHRTATIHYGYYNTSVSDYFSYVSKITTRDEMSQVIGYNDTANIIVDKLEDIRREVSNFYSITIAARSVVEIFYNEGKYYRDADKKEEMQNSDWSDLNIYYIASASSYYSGKPNGNTNVISIDKPPEQYFKFNNTYILDLSTGNAYLSSDKELAPNPLATEKFVTYTQGIYKVVGNIGEINQISLSTGVYVDLAYEVKEIEYSVEEISEESAKKYADWEAAKEAYKNDQTEDNKEAQKDAYTAYYASLTSKVSQEKAK